MRIKKAIGFIFFILRCIFMPYLFFRYGLRFDRSVSKKLRAPCVIISNHITFHDQFIVGLGFRIPMNFVASDSLFRNGVFSKIMKALARPIPISKGAPDPSTVKNMMAVIKSGGSVALFPEGNRSFFGASGHVNPTIAKFIKKMRVPLVIVNIRGGYNTSPRWRAKVSKGRMDASVRRIVTPDEMDGLTDETLFDLIMSELYFNEFEYNAVKKTVFKGKHKAEYLETVLFHCPSCGSVKSLKSERNDFYCTECSARVRIDKYGFFEKVSNADKLPETITEWSRIQEDAIKNTDFKSYGDEPLFIDRVQLFSYERAKRNELIAEGEIKLFSDCLEICGNRFNIADINDMALQDVNKIQIYMGDGRKFFAKSLSPRTNLLKYMAYSYKIKSLIYNKGSDYYGY